MFSPRLGGKSGHQENRVSIEARFLRVTIQANGLGFLMNQIKKYGKWHRKKTADGFALKQDTGKGESER